jgi:hypothetical protein
MNGFAQTRLDAESFSDTGDAVTPIGSWSSFRGSVLGMIPYFNLRSAQSRTQQIPDQFNAAEKLWRSLKVKQPRRRKFHPELSPELHKQLDLLDFATSQAPKDCIGFLLDS